MTRTEFFPESWPICPGRHSCGPVAVEGRDARQTCNVGCIYGRCQFAANLGHPIDSISRVAGVAARMEPGARAPLDAQYFKRIEAIEFAVKFDDGAGGRGLD